MSYPQSKTQPWSHQLRAYAKAAKFDGYYLAHKMGRGKSKSGVDYCNGTDARKVLIVCPKKVIGVWPRQFELHSFHPYRILPLTKGTANDKAHEVMRFLTDCERLKARAVVVVNYDTFWRSPLGPSFDNRNRITNAGVLAQIPWDVLICDEAHRIKSPSGRASWGMTRLAASAKRRLFLSGTPMPHGPCDLYAQFRAMDSSIFGRSFALFKRRYCVFGGYENRQIIGYTNMDEFRDKFYSRADFADDPEDLPEKLDVTIECDLDPRALKVYAELERDFISQVESGYITVKNALDKLLRLSQIASGILPVTGTEGETKVETIDSSKMDTALELIEDIEKTEPVVIFCRFREELRRLTEAIEAKFEGERKVGEISGRVKPPSDFIGGVWQATDTNVLLVQIQAGGEGIDLTAAKYCIYLSLGYSLGQYDQSKARIHRPGQTRKVVYYHVIARKTVDKTILKAIQKKRDVVDYIMKRITKANAAIAA